MWMRMARSLAVLAVTATALAQSPARAAVDMEAMLAKIATYQYGQSREALAQFSLFLEGSLGSPSVVKDIETGLLAFLQSDATPAGKEFAFRQLSLIATGASVPVLAGMLTAPRTSEMARYALARIPGPA